MSTVERLRATLVRHPRALASTAAALWARVGRKLEPSDLEWARGLGSENGPQLLWDGLQEAGALNGGILEPAGLQHFLGEIVVGEACKAVPTQTALVWTLPVQHPASKLRGQSLLAAAKQIIADSEHTLLITAPFIEIRGFGSLMDGLQGALSRGVTVTVLSHNLLNIGSSESAAIEELRRMSSDLPGCFHIYSAVVNTDAPRKDHPLLHAKLVIADESEALVSSANLTIYGLTSNFEVGVCIKGDEVSELSDILLMLMSCPLTTHVATVN